MGMLDGLLGGIVGAGMVSVVNNIIEKHGGLQGVVSEFERNGLGATVKSWVGTGPINRSRPTRYTGRSVPICCSSWRRNPACRYRTWRRSFAGAAPGRRHDDAGRDDPEGMIQYPRE